MLRTLCLAFLTLLTPMAALAQAVVIENVTVIPMDRQRVLQNQTVVVEGKRIAAIGSESEVAVPEEAFRIDGEGKFLIPGLTEMHAHIPSPQQGQDVLDRFLVLNVANGITTVRGMLGHPRHLELREQTANGEVLGPQILAGSPSLNGNSVPDVETARRLVPEYSAAGYDHLKIHPGVRREVFDVIVSNAAREGITFSGHIPAEVGLEHALDSGISTVEHLDGIVEWLAEANSDTRSLFFGYNLIARVDEAKIREVAQRIAATGAWVTPTQVLLEVRLLEPPSEIARRPEMKYAPQEALDAWVRNVGNLRSNPDFGFTREGGERFIELRRKIIKALHEAGAGLVLGADAPQVFNIPGYATLRELSAMVDAGLTPYQALELGTRNPAEAVGRADSFGTIEVGKRADLILLEANPLDDIDNVTRQAGVMVGGRWMARDEIERLLAGIAYR